LNTIKNCWNVGNSCGRIFYAVRESALNKRFTATLGGDHSIASATIGAMLSVYENLSVIWIDAHGDCNIPETSLSHNYHGMPAAHIMGWFKKRVPGFEWIENLEKLPSNRIAFIGLRSLDEAEKRMMIQKGVHCFTMTDIDKLGIGQVMEQALQRVDPLKKNPIHLSFDIDACDPSIAPGSGTKARGGINYREAHYICKELAATKRLVGIDMVEINPSLDQDEDELHHGDQLPIAENTTKTVRLGLELLASCLGEAIL